MLFDQLDEAEVERELEERMLNVEDDKPLYDVSDFGSSYIDDDSDYLSSSSSTKKVPMVTST